jgi:MIP family channel proteins
MKPMLRKMLVEGIGTFALVFAGTGAIVVDDFSHGAVTHVGVAITFGLVVMAMIYAIGDESGSPMNPAVSAGFFLARRLPAKLLIGYWFSQMVGAFVASLVLRLAIGNRAMLGSTIPAGSDLQSFIFEAILTAILMFVILRVSHGSKEVGVMAGIAVGGVIGLEAMFAGPGCGGSMNPARSLAPAVVSGHLTSIWVYRTAPFLGAAMAVPIWSLTTETNGESE